MDPMFHRLGVIRQQEILEAAAQDGQQEIRQRKWLYHLGNLLMVSGQRLILAASISQPQQAIRSNTTTEQC